MATKAAKSPKKIAEETNPDFQLSGIGNYAFVKTLGEGNFAKVKLAKHKMTGQEVAIKIIDKTQLDDKKLQKLYREVRIMKLLHHPNIVRLYEVIETKSTVFLVMEYSSGGELYDYLVVHGRMKEKEARAKFRQILSAVSYCHKKHVIHRDLKAENLLLDGNLDVKIADFGFSNQYDPEGKLDTFCGSPPYAAPELFQGRRYVGPEVDVWSLGVILYVLTTGCLPFDGKNLQEMRESVCRGKYRIPFYLSDPCEKLLRKFLVRDPAKRASLDIIIDDPWLMEGYSDTPICNDLSTRINEDENLIKMIEQKFHLEREMILKSIRDNVYDDISALYYLMYHERDRTGDYSRVNQVLNGATIPSLPASGMQFGVSNSSMPMSAITLPRMPSSIGNTTGKASTPSSKDANASHVNPDPPIQSISRDSDPGNNSGNKMATITEDHVTDGNDGPIPPSSSMRTGHITPGSQSSSTARSVSTTPRRRRFTIGTDSEKNTSATTQESSEVPVPIASPIEKPGTAPVSPSSPIGMANKESSGPHTSALGGVGQSGSEEDSGARKRTTSIVGILRSTMGRSRTAENGNGQEPGPSTPSVEESSAGVSVTGGDELNRPRSLRFTFNSNTTSNKPPDEVVTQVIDGCTKLNISQKTISRYLIECQYALPQTREVVRFEIEVCKLPRLKNLHGLKFKRLSGPSNDYKVICESLLANVNL